MASNDAPAAAAAATPPPPPSLMEDLLNGGETDGYRWGQTLEEVTVHIDVGPGVRAKELVVDIKRASVRVAKKAEPDAAPLLHGDLQQPVLASESTWMLSDGVLQLTLAKDIRRAANVSGGPGSEWWHGLLEGEDTLDHSKVSVGDYVSIDQVPAEQREGVLQASRADHERQVERAAAAAAEAALPASQREGLEKLRAQFPDIPIEYGDTSKFDAAHGL